MQDAKEEIRSRLSIEDVVSQYIELKRAGRNLKALSPFTSEKTPSFMVSPEKGIWHDFSSNKGGDIFTFVMEVEGMSFREALEHLANKAGVDLSMYNSGTSASVSAKKKKLLEILALAERYYQHALTKNRHALEYAFYKRNFNRKTIEEFRVGYAPGTGSALVDFLASKGHSKNDLIDAGLTNRYGSDLYKSRLIIPLMDTTGATIGFTGRIVDDDPNSPKYLNTPQTLLYDKSRHVFGLSQAKDSIRKSEFAVVVEGNLDVISSHQAGVRNAVASAGTAMTEYHLKAISRFTTDIRLAFDGDSAGISATERVIGIAANLGIELSIISDFGTAKDPDELIQQSPSLWQNTINNHKPAIDWLLQQYEQKLDLDTASGKRQYSTVALRLVNQLADPVVRDHYLKIISAKLNSSLDALRSKSTSLQDTPSKIKKTVKVAAFKDSDSSLANQDSILALALFQPKLRGHLKDVSIENFASANRQKILKLILSSDQPAETLDISDDEVDTYAKVLLLRAEGRYPNWSDEELSHELEKLLENMLTEKLTKQKKALDLQLRDAEILGDQALSIGLLAKINQINKEIKSAKRRSTS